MSNVIKLGTHSGPFHADDVIAGAILIDLYDEAAFVRSRNPAVLAECEVVWDVGGVYDPDAKRYDHHQAGCKASWPGTDALLSSAGMVWLHHGYSFLDSLDVPEEHMEEVRDRVYLEMICHIDAIDIGVGPLTAEAHIGGTLSRALGLLNPPRGSSEDEELDRFCAAVEFGREVLAGKVREVSQDIADRQLAVDLSSTGEEIVLIEQPLSAILFSEVSEHVKLLVYPSGNQWMVQCVPPKGQPFNQRHPLPEAWKGRRGPGLAELLADGPAKDEAMADVAGATCFVHNFRFIGGMKTKEGALDLARQALAL